MKPKINNVEPLRTPKLIEEVLQKVFSQESIPPPPPKEYVYLTKSDFGYKIGRTTRPDKRPLSVASNMPIKLTVIAVIEVPNSKAAEKTIHSYFADKRLRGEWFALTDEDVELIKGFPKTFEGLPFREDIPFW